MLFHIVHIQYKTPMCAMTLSRAPVEAHTRENLPIQNIQTAIKVLQVSAFPNLRYRMFIIFDALSHKSPRVQNSHGEVMNLVKVFVMTLL